MHTNKSPGSSDGGLQELPSGMQILSNLHSQCAPTTGGAQLSNECPQESSTYYRMHELELPRVPFQGSLVGCASVGLLLNMTVTFFGATVHQASLTLVPASQQECCDFSVTSCLVLLCKDCREKFRDGHRSSDLRATSHDMQAIWLLVSTL